MSKSQHTEAQMIGALKQMEAGRKAEDVAREVGLVEIEGGAGFRNFLHGELAYRDLVRKIGLTPVQ